MADEEDAAQKRRKGTIAGILMIVLGVLSSFVVSYMDSTSFDVFRMMNATDLAVVHAVLWSIAGLLVILWYNRQPPDSGDAYPGYEPDDHLR